MPMPTIPARAVPRTVPRTVPGAAVGGWVAAMKPDLGMRAAVQVNFPQRWLMTRFGVPFGKSHGSTSCCHVAREPGMCLRSFV